MKAKELKPKKLYKGVFSFHAEMKVKYLVARSPEQAKVFMMRRIAKEQEVPYSYVFGMFDGHKNNFSVKEEKIDRKITLGIG